MNLGNRSPLVLDVFASLSVPINGILVPFRQVVYYLQRFCKPLLFNTGYEIYDIAFSGSAFLINFQGECLLVCTRHQFNTPNSSPFSPDMVVMPVSIDGVVFGAKPIGARYPQFSEARDRTWDDIIAVKFEAGTNDPKIKDFLRLDWPEVRTLKNLDLRSVVSIFAIGFPTSSTDYELVQNDNFETTGVSVKSRWIVLFLVPVDRNMLDHETRIQFVQHSHYEINLENPDGMSGSPVFFIYFDQLRVLRLGFAGMITSVRGSVYQIYDGDNIRDFLFGRGV